MGRRKPQPPKKQNGTWWLVALLALLPILVFAQVARHQFLNYDDWQFVWQNEAVKQGLTAGSLRWAFTSTSIGYYPLTWLSHMLDVELFGMNAGAHLLVALALHVLSTIVLFLALRRMTVAPVRSAFVAALFAIHPMHVESVAWVSERKDTLSTLFGMLALLAYVWRPRRLWLVAVALAASLLAKQMLITLPFVLLLLDWWPLRRLNVAAVKEKIPLFALTILGAVVAVIGQRNLNAMQSVAAVPLSQRLANAAVAYVKYLGKLVWPADMAAIYPMAPVGAAAIGAVALLLGITAAAWVLRARAPYFLVGWLWYLGTLVPVIGIVQIGAQSMADRYTYFPYIGLFMAIVWAAYDLAVRPTTGAVIVVILAFLAFRQTGYWATSETLFEHAIAVTGPNAIAEYSLGQALQTSDPDRAIPHLRRAVAIAEDALRANPSAAKPDTYVQSYVAIGTALVMKARAAADPGAKLQLIADARREYETALRLDPHAAHAQRNIEIAGQMQADALLNAGTAAAAQNDIATAIARYSQAVALAPQLVEPHVYLALGLGKAGRNAEAAGQLRIAESLDAKAANDFVTRAMRLPPGEGNLRNLLVSLEQAGR